MLPNAVLLPGLEATLPPNQSVSCLVQSAPAGNKKESRQVRSGSEVLTSSRLRDPGPAGRAFPHSAHRHEYSAPRSRARAGGVPTSPRGPARPGCGDPAPRLVAGRGHPALPETLAPGPAAQAEAGQLGRSPIGASRAGSAGPREVDAALRTPVLRAPGRDWGRSRDDERKETGAGTRSPTITALMPTP